MMLLATNSTIRRYRAAKRKKRKLYYIVIYTYKSCIRHSNKCIIPKG